MGNFIEKYTGAKPDRWWSRAKEFIQRPERRAEMLCKLAKVLSLMMEKKERWEEIDTELLSQQNDSSGLTTYFFIFGTPQERKQKERKNEAAISVMPPGALIEEVFSPDNEPISGAKMSLLLVKKDPTRYHFVFSPSAASYAQGLYDENKPLHGLWRNGVMITPLKRKNEGVPTDELESGGIIFDGNYLTLGPYSELVKAAESGRHVEQSFFIASDAVWREIINLLAYKGRFLTTSFVGYFEGEQSWRYFVAEVGISPLEKTFTILDQLKVDLGYQHWHAACLDVGGFFGGMTRLVGKKELDLGISAEGKGKFQSYGHSRARFFSFSWSKPI